MAGQLHPSRTVIRKPARYPHAPSDKLEILKIVTPYEKDGELRMKYTNRDGNPARVAMPILPTPES